MRNHCLINFAVEQGSFRIWQFIQLIPSMYFTRTLYVTTSAQNKRKWAGAIWGSLYQDILLGNTFCSRFDRKQAGKGQFPLDLPVCFWISIPGITRMAFIYLAQVQMPTYLVLLSSTRRLTGVGLMDIRVIQTQWVLILNFFGTLGGEFDISGLSSGSPKLRQVCVMKLVLSIQR